MDQGADHAWRFSASSTEELTRRFVLVEHLEEAYGLSREQLVAAAQAEPRFCHLGKFFKVIGPDGTRGYHVTHIAFNPDEGYEPARPYRATDVFGPVMRAQKRRRSDTSPPEEESPAVAARQQEAPESPGGATPKPRRLSRPVKGRHGAGGVDAFANANTEKAVAARTFYRNELAFLEAQLEERVEARLADEGAKMKRDAVASVAKANEEARWQYERKAATQLQLVEEALAEERRLNAEMKTHEWREENLYEPRRRAHEALQAAEQRASSAEQRACAADAQRIEAVSAADAAARACGADYDRALAAETQKVAESTSELADCVLLLQQSTDTCDARKRECRRSGKELASVRQKLDAVTADLETSSLRKRWLESTNQSLYDRLENKAGRIRELLTEARQHKIDAAASARTLVASQKLTAQLQGAGGVDARLFDNAAIVRTVSPRSRCPNPGTGMTAAEPAGSAAGIAGETIVAPDPTRATTTRRAPASSCTVTVLEETATIVPEAPVVPNPSTRSNSPSGASPRERLPEAIFNTDGQSLLRRPPRPHVGRRAAPAFSGKDFLDPSYRLVNTLNTYYDTMKVQAFVIIR
jgi:hypothetical protein